MRVVSRYGPPVAVMAVIFALSAQPDLGTDFGTIDLVLRKLSHVMIYAILWLAVARALHWRRPIATTVFTLLYACSDELHQSFVDGRHGTPVDVAIDAVGMAIAAVATWPRRRGRASALTASRAR